MILRGKIPDKPTNMSKYKFKIDSGTKVHIHIHTQDNSNTREIQRDMKNVCWSTEYGVTMGQGREREREGMAIEMRNILLYIRNAFWFLWFRDFRSMDYKYFCCLFHLHALLRSVPHRTKCPFHLAKFPCLTECI